MPSTVFKGKKYFIWGFPGGSVVKNLPAKQETRVQFLGQEYPLEKEMATHSSRLAREIQGIYAAAAAKSFQLCPTLCDPRYGSPPGPAVPGILQARTLEWVAISSSSA